MQSLYNYVEPFLNLTYGNDKFFSKSSQERVFLMAKMPRRRILHIRRKTYLTFEDDQVDCASVYGCLSGQCLESMLSYIKF